MFANRSGLVWGVALALAVWAVPAFAQDAGDDAGADDAGQVADAGGADAGGVDAGTSDAGAVKDGGSVTMTADGSIQVPDASVDQGGADHTSEENDPNAATCTDSKSCDQGFECVASRCVPSPTRNASGCDVGAGFVPAASLLLLAWRRRRNR